MLKSQGDTLLTFTPAESFLTSLWISIYFGLVLALPVIFWQVWQFFVPAVDKAHARLIKYFVFLAWVLAVVGLVFGYFIVLPARARSSCSASTATPSRTTSRPSRSSPSARTSSWRWRLVWELPLFVVALTRLGIIKTDSCARTAASATSSSSASRSRCRASTRSRVFFETLPLVILFECSIWLSVLLDRRSRTQRTRGGAAVET